MGVRPSCFKKNYIKSEFADRIHQTKDGDVRVNQMKKEYTVPEMKVFRLERHSNLLQSSDGDKTPVIHGPIGEAPFDNSNPMV